MVTVLDPSQPLAAPFRQDVQDALTGFLTDQRPVLAGVGTELEAMAQLAEVFTGGGKRLRPAFALWGYVAAAGLPVEETYAALVRAAASLELLHVSALMHDDVMDNSDTRRGVPAAHLQFADLHDRRDWVGAADQFGRAGAILLGDLLLVWSDEMVQTAGLAPAVLGRARPYLAAMRTEVTCGQYLDVVAQAQPLRPDRLQDNIDQVRRVVEFKSARYSVQRPVQFGAAMGDADEQLQAALAAYGSPLGRAFQYRDDLLGVFGDERVIGKPAGGDLREGKHTLLLAYALAGSGEAGQNRLMSLVGSPDLSAEGITEARDIIDTSGARTRVEADIQANLERSLAALDRAPLSGAGREALVSLAHAAVSRSV
ncbi:geranylgeranyl diphosphate synthase, type I [Raineyella antarctica]|uniref:Geranylgeranyl diphosphate synthase, type I n=1 Tax=Raineyella antarctica TaxID=1577474 RepID=A0A1G6GDT8_9ACTN|nr:polyprenyl synthetase family protein [Raineyella antarctica]SDB80140.1 geranylgeranyl diphosphate synthase, type I [Raineyella antarctica]